MLGKTKKSFLTGQSLFEVVVTVAVSALIVTAIVAMATNSIQNSSYSRDKTIASNYAQETMEWLRSERDQNTAIFNEKSGFSPLSDGHYCINNLSWPTVPGKCQSDQVITGTKFIREVVFLACANDPCPNNIIQAQVTVFWQDSKGVHDVKSTTDIYIK